MKEQVFGPDDIIFSKGDYDERIYFIKHGKISLSYDNLG